MSDTIHRVTAEVTPTSKRGVRTMRTAAMTRNAKLYLLIAIALMFASAALAATIRPAKAADIAPKAMSATWRTVDPQYHSVLWQDDNNNQGAGSQLTYTYDGRFYASEGTAPFTPTVQIEHYAVISIPQGTKLWSNASFADGSEVMLFGQRWDAQTQKLGPSECITAAGKTNLQTVTGAATDYYNDLFKQVYVPVNSDGVPLDPNFNITLWADDTNNTGTGDQLIISYNGEFLAVENNQPLSLGDIQILHYARLAIPQSSALWSQASFYQGSDVLLMGQKGSNPQCVAVSGETNLQHIPGVPTDFYNDFTKSLFVPVYLYVEETPPLPPMTTRAILPIVLR